MAISASLERTTSLHCSTLISSCQVEQVSQNGYNCREMGNLEQDSFEGRPPRRSKYVSLASMSVLVVIIGVLLTFALPRVLPSVLPEETGPTTASAPMAAPAGTLAPIPLPVLDIPSPTPTPVPRVYQLALGTGGSLTEDVQVISEDGLAVLGLARGTKVMDAQGRPLSSVTMTARRLPLRTDAAWVGLAYEFGPAGATLDPPASLTISYDPRANYPFQVEQVDTRQVYLSYLGENGPIRPALASVSRQAASITATIDRLVTFVLYCDFSRPPYPGF